MRKKLSFKHTAALLKYLRQLLRRVRTATAVFTNAQLKSSLVIFLLLFHLVSLSNKNGNERHSLTSFPCYVHAEKQKGIWPGSFRSSFVLEDEARGVGRFIYAGGSPFLMFYWPVQYDPAPHR